MSLQPLPSARFVRRTSLGPNEYRKNFRQLDGDVIAAVTSREADKVTPLMSKIYLRLVSAPSEFWEREGVLYFTSGEMDGRPLKASKVLYEVLGVSSATAHKALGWMHEQGIIGYFSGKNGAGIRIFLNRAANSIGVRPQAAGKKILPFSRSSNDGVAGSSIEPAFKDSYADLEILEKDVNPCAPKSSAETKPVGKTSSASTRPPSLAVRAHQSLGEREPASEATQAFGAVLVEEILLRLRGELEPCIRETAARAAAQSASREMERTREWFETKALPKAVRVAQRETYDLLRKHGAVEGRPGKGSAGLEVGRGAGDYAVPAARPQTPEEVRETAEVCVALFESQGKPIEVTLAEISSEGGGWLLPQDVERVREAARELSLSWGIGGKG
ncbi:MAG TPA: hypothetical protein VK422_15030 [Pyrinomonadaceae bacterium]|nr:hypothetical protein [Pyrinomonadaceae bacterium]